MKIEVWNLDRIRPYPNNPRINDDAVDAVAASIREFGVRQAIVVDTDGVIICGHTRFKAAQKLGLEKLPVHVAKDLTPEQIKAYRIADNKTAELADWNYDLLPIELGDLQTNGFDLSLLGFDSDELLKLLKTDVEEGLTDPDDVPAPPDAAVTQPGDLWILGNHRLLCGDSSKPEDLDRLLGGKTIQLVNTDPPYNVKVEPRSNNAIAAGLSSFSNDSASQKLKGGQGNAASFGVDHETGKPKHPPTHKKLRAKDRPLANDFVTDEEFDRLLDAWFSGLLKLLYPNEQCDKEAVRRCLEYALEARRRVKEQLKKIGGMEFFDVHFSYIDLEKSEEKFITVPEQGGGGLIPDGPLNPGVLHTVATGSGSHLGLYRIETQVTPGNGALKMSGFGSNSQAKEAVKVGFDYFKANSGHVSASIKALDHDYHLHVVELHNTGANTSMTLAAFVALCSAVLGKPSLNAITARKIERSKNANRSRNLEAWEWSCDGADTFQSAKG